VLFWIAVLAAALTSFYMCRLYFLVFWGDFRGWAVGRPSQAAPEEIHGNADLHDSHGDDLMRPGYAPHESPWQMTVPLIILAAFSLFAGVINPGFHLMAEPPLEHWLHPVFADALADSIHVRSRAAYFEGFSAAVGFMAFAVGSIVAWWAYVAQGGQPTARLAGAFPRLYGLVRDKWRIDELYDATVIAQVDSLAETASVFDSGVVDGLVSKLTSLVVATAGSILRVLQNGVVQMYAAWMVIGLASIGWFFAVPHAQATVSGADSEDVIVSAAPGVGYAYRWDANGDGRPDTPEFSAYPTLKMHLTPGQVVNVTLEVKNAFGFVATRVISVSMPHAPTSSL
jgi:NADH-quinone oxidoreductase subunit L